MKLSGPIGAIISGVLGGATAVYMLGGPTWAAFGIGWIGFLLILWGH